MRSFHSTMHEIIKFMVISMRLRLMLFFIIYLAFPNADHEHVHIQITSSIC